MFDIVVYTKNVPALIDEAIAKGYENWVLDDGTGEPSLGGDRTPLIWKWPEAIALIRITDLAAVAGFTNMSMLGHYEDGEFAAVGPTEQALYDKLYPRTPVEVETIGGTVEVVPPVRIGSFA